jgi:hypothetical protein
MADRNPILSSVSDPSVQFNTDALTKKDQEAEVAIDAVSTDITNIVNGTTPVPSSIPERHSSRSVLAPGYWYRPYPHINAIDLSSSAFGNQLYTRAAYVPLVIGEKSNIDLFRIGYRTQNASTTVGIAIYTSVNGLPGNLVMSTISTIPASAAGFNASFDATINQTLNGGLYWIHLASSSLALLFTSAPTTGFDPGPLPIANTNPTPYTAATNRANLVPGSAGTYGGTFPNPASFSSSFTDWYANIPLLLVKAK